MSDAGRVLRTAVRPRDPKGRREGFTTGACAAAAAKAATRLLRLRTAMDCIESTLPNGARHTFTLERCELVGDGALCSIVKDGGDDPDCTHGAEIVAEVYFKSSPGVELRGGVGVATVTKPGLGLEVGQPAINPVPRRNITEMVLEELQGLEQSGLVVIISVPEGERLALQTTNPRLGLLGGISILGTTGIVKPYSTAAYRASVVQAIDVARGRQLETLVFTTGGKSEAYAMRLYPDLPEEAFVQVGDFIGVGVRHAARRGASRAVIVGMMGKLSKMADGKVMTHAAGSDVNLELLARFAAELGADTELCGRIASANTARHVLEIATASGLSELPSLICRKAAAHLEQHASALGELAVQVVLVDFDGRTLGRSDVTAHGASGPNPAQDSQS